MPRTFIIGDIHGCCKTFSHLVTKKIELNKSDELYCLGDYIDRGSDAKGVVDFIIGLREEGYNIHTLRGNHEQMLLDSLSEPYRRSVWMENSADKTLHSFGVKSAAELDPKYLEFFRETEFLASSNEFILAHAGLNFAADNPLEDTEAMLWIRNFPVDKNFLNGKVLIHGHTPMKKDLVLGQKFEGAIDIDGGCVYKKREGMGNLIAIDFREKRFIVQENID